MAIIARLMTIVHRLIHRKCGAAFNGRLSQQLTRSVRVEATGTVIITARPFL